MNLVVNAIVKRGNHFLIIKRSSKDEIHPEKWSFPGGKLEEGETILEAAERELKEKTGVSAKLKHRGDVYLTTYENNDLLSQTLCHIFSGDKPVGRLVERSEKGECFWAKWDTMKKSELIPGFAEIVKLLKDKPAKNLFFGEYVFKLKS